MKSLVVLNECRFSQDQINLLKRSFQNVAIYADTTTEEQAIKRVGDRNIIIMDQFVFSFGEKLLKSCPHLELVIVNTNAYDALDIELLNKYNVKLAHLKEYATEDVAEVGMGMIFALNNKIEIAKKLVTNQKTGLPGYSYDKKIYDIDLSLPIVPYLIRKPLDEQTLGIIGLGNIGKKTAELALGLGMKVVGFNRTKKFIKGVTQLSLKKVLSNSDIIFISLRYDKKTMKHFLKAKDLSLIKKDTHLISIAHPDLIDMQYVINNHSKFNGIGFDYLVTQEVKKLLKVRKYNIIVTPHLGHQSTKAYHNLTTTIIEAALSFGSSKELHLVN